MDPPGRPRPPDAEPAAGWLEAVASGWAEPPGAPAVVVGTGSGPLGDPVPASLPCVVVGVGRAHPDGPAPPALDVALCPGPPGSGPPGWVALADPEDEARRLVERAAANPRAAVVLAQVLRMAGRLGAVDGLVLESAAYATLQAGPTHGAWLASRTSPRPRPADPSPAVLAERVGDTLAVTLNRPASRNALDVVMRDALCDALAVAAADPGVRRVLLSGAGPAFCSGGDLAEFGTAPDPASAHLVRCTRSPARLLHAVATRTTARLHGACIGAGIELAAVAARVEAAPGTVVALPEVGMGLIPGAGGTVSIPRRIGRQRTAWLALSGAAIGPEVARPWGLCDAGGPRPQ